jgi:nitrogen-specific signal transduction histidine kinase/CheY-like chemotaxis protein
MTKAPLRDSSGAATGLFGIGRDVTERRRLELLLRQSQKMEALGQLAGGVAHDFNNLLQTILTHAEFAQENLAQDSPAFQDLDQLLRATDMAAGLARQLLAFGRRQVLEPVDLDLNRVVTDLMRMIRRVIGENIQLEIQAGPNLGNIHADPGQIEQIVTNLCINARDAMLDGGTISIETRNEELESDFCHLHPEAQTGPYVVLTVRDTGAGMDEATQTRIFEPFFTTKWREHGTGLGLSTVYGIVRQHNGLVLVGSAPGRGTTFDVYLPVTAPHEAETAPSHLPPHVLPPGGSETILVAEDDRVVRNLLATLLQRAGYTALVACDGEEAIRLYDQHADRIAMAMVDAVMPHVGGRAVCEHIRAGHPDLPILVCTGYGGDLTQTGFVQDLGLEVVMKPHNSTDMLRKIRKMLDTPNQGTVAQ